MQPEDIKSWIARVSADHPLRASSAKYIDGFSRAASHVYGNRCEKHLQEKFFVPNDAGFKISRYLQFASELSVQNHLATRDDVANLEIDKKVHPPKNVEVFFNLPPTNVALEVKCAEELTSAEGNSERQLAIQTAGRVPGYRQNVFELQTLLNTAPEPSELRLVKNNDNKLKDYLLQANAKFSPNCGANDLNILLVACGDVADLRSWHGYLKDNQGLFTPSSFHDTDAYKLINVVILSNLKYCHSVARDWHDWTLNDVFLVPVRNPYHRRTLFGETVTHGLSVFDHHLLAFLQFAPQAQADVPAEVVQSVKMIHYVEIGLPRADRQRYFPTMGSR